MLDLISILTKKKSRNSDNLRILRNWAEYTDDRSRMRYLMFELEIEDYPGHIIHFYKAVKLARVTRLPESAKQSESFMTMHAQILTSVWRRNIKLVTIIANILNPVALGLLFCYGVQGVGETEDAAKLQADNDYLALKAALQGTYRVLEFSLLKYEELEWIREKMYTMKNLTVIRGIPKPKEGGVDAGNTGIGSKNINPDSQDTTEEFIAGMSEYEYVVEVLSSPVKADSLERWLQQTAQEMTLWNKQLQGTSTVNFSLSIPMMYMANLGASEGWSHSYTDADSVSTTQSDSYTTSFSNSIGESMNQSVGQTLGRSLGQSYTESYGQNHGINVGENFGGNVGSSLSDSWGNTVGESAGTNIGYSENQSHSDSINSSDSTSFSESQSHSISKGTSGSTTNTTGTSHTIGESSSHSVGSSSSHSVGTNSSTTSGTTTGWTDGHSSSEGTTDTTNRGQNWSHTDSTNWNISETEGSGWSGGGSLNLGPISGNGSYNQSSSETGSAGGGNSDSSGHSITFADGTTTSTGTNYSDNFSRNNSTTTGSSVTNTTGTSITDTKGTSESWGTSQSQSVSNGWNSSVSDTTGTSNSVSHTDGTGESWSTGAGQSWGASMSASQSANAGSSAGVSQGNSWGDSSGESWGTSQTQSYGKTQTDSISQSVTQGTGKSWGQSQGVSQGQSWGTSNGQSLGQAIGSTGSITSSTMSTMGLGPSMGYAKSYQWLDQEVQNILTLLDFQNQRLMKSLRGNGAFITDLYIATQDNDALTAASILASSAWHSDQAMICPLQILDLPEEEQTRLLYHFSAFSPDNTKENLDGRIESYRYSTVLLPDEFTAYTHLPRISEGGIYADVGDIPKFAVPSMMKGDIYMGHILSAETWNPEHGNEKPFEYRLQESELMHAIFTGESRSGKTVAATRFAAELTKVRRKTGKRLRIIALDPKQDWRILAKFVEPERFHFYSLGNPEFLPINLNICKVPHNVFPQVWIDGIIEIYCRCYGLMERGKAILAETFYELYTEAGVFEDSANWREFVPERSSHVTLPKIFARMEQHKRDLDDPVKSGKGRAGNEARDAYTRVIDRLQVFGRKTSIETRLFGQEDGIGIDELIQNDDITVLESYGLESTFKNFIFGCITSGFFKYAQGHEGGFLADDQYETVMIIEEANEVLTGSDSAARGGQTMGLQGQSEFEKILDQAAGLGLFIVAITQKIADMPSSVVANAGLLFAGKISREEDTKVVIRKIGREERLDDRDILKWFPRSPIGWFVCRSGRNYNFLNTEPILVHIDPLNVSVPDNKTLEGILSRQKAMELLKQG